jgi:hypothetical protein
MRTGTGAHLRAAGVGAPGPGCNGACFGGGGYQLGLLASASAPSRAFMASGRSGQVAQIDRMASSALQPSRARIVGAFLMWVHSYILGQISG